MATKYRGVEREELALTTFIKLNRSVNSVIERTFRREPLPEGLTVSRFAVLEALFHLGPLCQRELGRKILKTKGNTSVVVDHLTSAGLVQRRRNPEDRREQRVSLTEKGTSLIGDYFPRYASALADEFAVLDLTEQRRLGELCRKLGTMEEVR
ncbi:MAG: MarR family winged helix-turn-helix transcriptional regulator [Alkalispirochaetaceae bacterium]